ncbi:MAG: hypothetical protein GXP27_18970 [Planctomycetes bacterium]|nr:hypothetical protein [Planctomycetota bacterium]
MNPQECLEPVQTARLEELLISSGAPRVTPSSALRQQVLREASRVLRRRRRIAQIQAAAVPLLVFAITWAGAAYSISALQRRAGDWLALKPSPTAGSRSPAAPVERPTNRTGPDTYARGADLEGLPEETLSMEEILNSDDPQAALNRVIQQADAWALVDAYGALRECYRRILRQALWQ